MTHAEALNFLKNVISFRFEKELKGTQDEPPRFPGESQSSVLGMFIRENHLSDDETVILLLALMPHIDPGFFTAVVAQYLPDGGDFPDFGGVRGKNHRGILPTGETALFVLGGYDLGKRTEMMRYFAEDHFFSKNSVLFLESVESGEPKMSGRLVMDDEFVDLFILGKISKPRFSADFPAEQISTLMEWDDLVLNEKTLNGIQQIEIWLKYNDALLYEWGMKGKIKPGFRVLFYGPPGTGKTLTACLLGKYTLRDVFRIDLSMVVSKYIGETEKNLSKLFDKAANKEWILFFDEADSIFGKRTGVRDAHDKYANQEVSYLLQRIESHPGLVILASNMKSNIDSAFTRRFNSMIEFENPDTNERLQLWKTYLPPSASIAKTVNIEDVARKYQLTGANIVNVIQFAGLQTLKKNSSTISADDLLKGIQKEYEKEGKMIRSE